MGLLWIFHVFSSFLVVWLPEIPQQPSSWKIIPSIPQCRQFVVESSKWTNKLKLKTSFQVWTLDLIWTSWAHMTHHDTSGSTLQHQNPATCQGRYCSSQELRGLGPPMGFLLSPRHYLLKRLLQGFLGPINFHLHGNKPFWIHEDWIDCHFGWLTWELSCVMNSCWPFWSDFCWPTCLEDVETQLASEVAVNQREMLQDLKDGSLPSWKPLCENDCGKVQTKSTENNNHIQGWWTCLFQERGQEDNETHGNCWNELGNYPRHLDFGFTLNWR